MGFISVAFGIYAIADACLARGVAFWPLVYSIIVIAFGMRLASSFLVKRRILFDKVSFFLAALCLVFLLRSFLQLSIIPVYVLGDLATIFLPLLCYLVVCNTIQKQDIHVLLKAFGGLSVIAYSLSPFVAEPGLGRMFAAPSIAAMTIPVFLLFESRSWLSRLLWFFCIVVVSFLALGCGQRSNIFVIAFAAILFGIPYFCHLNLRFKLAVVSASSIVLAVLLTVFVSGIDHIGFSSLDTGRLGTVFGVLQGQDDSINNRWDEVRDVMAQQRSVSEIFLGGGFGATYVVKNSYPERNVYEGELVHNIHFGPALVFHRFGILGVVSLSFVCLYTCYLYVVSFVSFAFGIVQRPLLLYFSGLLVIYFFSFLLRNVMNDPYFSFAIAVLLAQLRFKVGSKHYST